MGNKADGILHSFHFSEEDSKSTQPFEAYFVKKRNVIYERAKFNKSTASVDTFITDLHSLAEFCDYGALHDKLIRDRIVVGI